jgi:hypothetical protein
MERNVGFDKTNTGGKIRLRKKKQGQWMCQAVEGILFPLGNWWKFVCDRNNTITYKQTRYTNMGIGQHGLPVPESHHPKLLLLARLQVRGLISK